MLRVKPWPSPMGLARRYERLETAHRKGSVISLPPSQAPISDVYPVNNFPPAHQDCQAIPSYGPLWFEVFSREGDLLWTVRGSSAEEVFDRLTRWFVRGSNGEIIDVDPVVLDPASVYVRKKA